MNVRRLFAVASASILLSFAAVSSVFAYHSSQVEPVELLIDFAITGQLTGATPEGAPIYTIGGPGHAPWWIFSSGEIVDKKLPWRKVATLSNGQITFQGMPSDPILPFTCLQGSCTIETGGSTFTSNAGVALSGRAANLWGPVVNSPDFVPPTTMDNPPIDGTLPIRILGCGGLTEISGEGKYAGMVGCICFNGVLNFTPATPQSLTGSSKCTITLHTPAQGPIPPTGPMLPQ